MGGGRVGDLLQPPAYGVGCPAPVPPSLSSSSPPLFHEYGPSVLRPASRSCECRLACVIRSRNGRPAGPRPSRGIGAVSRWPQESRSGQHAGLRARPGASSRLAPIPGTERSPVKTLGRNYLRGLPYAKRHGYTSECAEDASTAAGYLIPPARHVGTGAWPAPYGSTC